MQSSKFEDSDTMSDLELDLRLDSNLSLDDSDKDPNYDVKQQHKRRDHLSSSEEEAVIAELGLAPSTKRIRLSVGEKQAREAKAKLFILN